MAEKLYRKKQKMITPNKTIRPNTLHKSLKTKHQTPKSKFATLAQVVSMKKPQTEAPQERPASADLDTEPNLYREVLNLDLG